MLEGGLPFPSSILISGETGTGKTTFGMQYLFKGAVLGERGMYFMAQGEPEELVLRFISGYLFVDARLFGSTIKYVDLSSSAEKGDAEEILESINSHVNSFQPRRIVFDSLSLWRDVLGEEYGRFLFRLSSLVRGWRGATLITAEPQPGVPYPLDIASMADGIILLYNTEIGTTRRRSLEILKMMGTSHRSGKHALDINANGIVVYPGL